MRIWPAIDLRGGKCVRLQQGDYQRETVFGDDPIEVARRWVDAGAECLHLVDLDAARDGSDANHEVVARIAAAAGVPCQLGGGVRDEQRVVTLLERGVNRLVVGTRALRDPDWFRDLCRRYPQRLVLGIDAREGRVATDGWLQTSHVLATELAAQWSQADLAAIVYTDIACDGMLAGPNLSGLAEMQRATPVPLIASGGVTTIDDVRAVGQLGLSGCIIGRALYEGRLELSAAIEAARGAS